MQISQYIIVKKKTRWSRGGMYSSRMTSNNPVVEPDEIAVNVILELPDALFQRSTLQANIVIPESAVTRPVIEAEVINNVQDIIKQNSGFDVRLEVINKEE